MNIDLGFIFKSPDFLHFKDGQYVMESHDDPKRIIKVEPNEKLKISYDIIIIRDGDEPLKESDILMSFRQMRIMERSQNKIIMHDWSVNEWDEPTTKYGLTFNLVDNQVYNCILNFYEKRIDYVFLNESEIHDPLYVNNYYFYQPYKNGIFTERLLNGYSKEWTFVNNQKHGEWKAISPNGRIEEIGNYSLGKPEGEYKSYWENDNVRLIWNYKNGRRTGLRKDYNREGILQFEGNELNDKRVGTWLFYNEKGEFDHDEDYGEKGKPLFFIDIGGSGDFTCRDCGFTQEIESDTHGFGANMIETIGYQCQSCGKFQTRTTTLKQRVIVDLTCECGGKIDREKPLFCPKCKSFNVEYHCTLMT